MFWIQKRACHHNYFAGNKDMCNWTILAGRRCDGLLEMMWADIRSGPYVQIDETTFQVLHEPERSMQVQSYMWVIIGYQTGKPIVIFHYHPTGVKRL